MIDYKELCECFIVILITAFILCILIDFTTDVANKKIEEKDEQIWQLETEIIDLKEQIHILKMLGHRK